VGGGATAQAILLAWDFSEAAGVPPDVAEQLAIVVEEWVANIVEHGGVAADGVIRLRLERCDGSVRIEVSDPGAPFDPREAEIDGPNLERGGGAGLALLRAWTSIELYAFREGRNEAVLRLPCPDA
jgi:serine/threonine-protein kinase RsbW